MDIVRTDKMKRLYEITNGLLSEMVKENQIELNNYLKPKDCNTLNDVYEQALSSLCNRQGMSKNIKFERNPKSITFDKKRHTQFKEILFDFDPKIVKQTYDNDKGLESLIAVFNKNKELCPQEKIDLQKKKSQWVIFGKGVISAAIFLSNFRDRDEFDVFVKDFQRNKYSRNALPMLLAKEIVGFGFALACDFLKESGYDGYPKPDGHLTDVLKESGLCDERNDYKVFKTIIEVAETVGKKPYEVDKRIWLVCTGRFYYDKKVADKEKELRQQLIEQA